MALQAYGGHLTKFSLTYKPDALGYHIQLKASFALCRQKFNGSAVQNRM